MERLWAPWRMEFITGDRTHPEEGCIFCSLLLQDDGVSNLVLSRGARSFVVMNKYPYANGHLMVVPIRHVKDFEALKPEEGAEMMASSQRCVAALREKLGAHGFNIGMNLGKVAGAGVEDHLHLHLVPRWEGDHNFMPVIGDLRVIPEHIQQTYLALRPAFSP